MVNNAVVDVTITGNTLHGNYTGTPEGNHPIGLGQGIFLFGATFNGTVTYNVSNNGTVAVPFRGNRQGGAIHVNKGSGTGTFSGTIENNVIGDPAVVGSGSAEAFGIIVGARGAGGSHTTLINNNQIRQYFDRGHRARGGRGKRSVERERHQQHRFEFCRCGQLAARHPRQQRNTCRRHQRRLPEHQRQLGGDRRQRAGKAALTSDCVEDRVRPLAFRGSEGRTILPPRLACRRSIRRQPRLAVTGGGFSNIASCPMP